MEEEREVKVEEKKRRVRKQYTQREKKLLTVIAVIVSGVIISGLIWLGSFQAKNFEQGEEQATHIHSQMQYLGSLHWYADEYRLRALIFCEDHKIFVENSQQYSASELVGCDSYAMAKGVFVKLHSNIFTGEGLLSFEVPKQSPQQTE